MSLWSLSLLRQFEALNLERLTLDVVLHKIAVFALSQFLSHEFSFSLVSFKNFLGPFIPSKRVRNFFRRF